MKKVLLILLTLCLFSACAKKYDTFGSRDNADVVNEELAQENESVKVEQIEVEDRVFFDLNSSLLTERAKEVLNTVVEALLADDNISKTITVEGHCDERGTAEYNMALGQKRANAVKQYLVKNGVKANRVRVVSFGKERPAVLGSGERVWSQNRRAVMVENTK